MNKGRKGEQGGEGRKEEKGKKRKEEKKSEKHFFTQYLISKQSADARWFCLFVHNFL